MSYMLHPPIERNKLAKRLTRGVDAVKAARRKGRELPEAEAREYERSAVDALITTAESVARELDTTLGRVDL